MLPEPYITKDTRPAEMLEAINRVKNKYSDQLDAELRLATTFVALHETNGKVLAMEHIFNELHDELSKIIMA